MPQTSKCPACSSPVGSDGSPAVQCPKCGGVVLLPATHARAIDPNNAAHVAAFGPLAGQARPILQMWNAVRGGNRVEGVRLYRNLFRVDFTTADRAVAALAGGRPVLLAGGRPTAAGPSRSAVVGACALFLATAVGVAAWVLMPPRNGAKPGPGSGPRPAGVVATGPVAPPVAVQPATPARPAFARLLAEFGTEGTGPGQFDDVRSIAVDGRGHVYVGEYTGGRVQVFDEAGKWLATWTADPSLPMTGMAAAKDGTVYVNTGSQILRYEGLTGRPLGEVSNDVGDKRVGYDDVYVAPDGTLYAIGQYTDAAYGIVVLTAAGQIKTFTPASDLIGEPVILMRVVADSKGNIFAMDRTKGIFKFSADGHYLKRFPTTRQKGRDVSSGYNLAVDSKDRVMVSSAGAAVTVFDAEGRLIDTFGDGGLVEGIVMNSRDELFACYRNDHVVRKFGERP